MRTLDQAWHCCLRSLGFANATGGTDDHLGHVAGLKVEDLLNSPNQWPAAQQMWVSGQVPNYRTCAGGRCPAARLEMSSRALQPRTPMERPRSPISRCKLPSWHRPSRQVYIQARFFELRPRRGQRVARPHRSVPGMQQDAQAEHPAGDGKSKSRSLQGMHSLPFGGWLLGIQRRMPKRSSSSICEAFVACNKSRPGGTCS